MNVLPKNIGWIEVICGPMFSGKTEELIRRLKRARYRPAEGADLQAVDRRRYSDGADRQPQRAEARVARPSNRPRRSWSTLRPDTQVVGIDEVQFFGADAVRVCEQLADRGLRVIVAGLDQDYRGVPFEPMPQLLAVAEYITKELAVCVVCGNPATARSGSAATSGASWWGPAAPTRPAAAPASARGRRAGGQRIDAARPTVTRGRRRRPAWPVDWRGQEPEHSKMRDRLYDHCQFRSASSSTATATTSTSSRIRSCSPSSRPSAPRRPPSRPSTSWWR